MSALDDASRIAAVDRSGMLAVVEAAAEHWREGVVLARAVDLQHIPDHAGLNGVVVCGMGGSGIAADVADKQAATQLVAERFAAGRVDWTDGLTVDFDEWWFNLRPSNTEPLLRLNVEARDESEGRARTEEILALIRR